MKTLKNIKLIALLIFIANALFAQKLLLKSGFESGVSITHQTVGTQMGAIIEGNDMGYDFNNLLSNSSCTNWVQYLIPATEKKFFNYAYANIATVMNENGAYTKALRFEITEYNFPGYKPSSGNHVRAQYIIEKPNIREGMYSSYKLRFQDNIEEVMSSKSSYRILAEVREGSGPAIEHRINFGIEQSGTALFWKMRCDETVASTGVSTKLWTEVNKTISVPTGTAKWFTLKMFVQQINDTIHYIAEVDGQLVFNVRKYVGFSQDCKAYHIMKLNTDTAQFSNEKVYQYYDDLMIFEGLPEGAFSSLSDTAKSSFKQSNTSNEIKFNKEFANKQITFAVDNSTTMDLNNEQLFNNTDKITLTCANMQGQLISAVNYTYNENDKYGINLQNLPSGIYMVSIFKNNTMLQSEKICVN